MSKYVEKVERYKHKILDAALVKLKEDYSDAEDFYRDTGHGRYFNKMSKCEKEINEIEEYLNGKPKVKDITTDEYRDFLKLKETMRSVKSNLVYLLADLPDCSETARLRDCMREIESYLK